MNPIQKKLNSKEGASILMALLLLMVAILVSVVILSAATTAARQLKDNRAAEQANLTVTGAAELLWNSIEGQTYQVKNTVKVRRSDGRTTANSQRLGASGNFAPLLNDAAAQIYNKEKNTVEQTFDITVEGLDPVTVKFTMDGEYYVRALFSLKGAEQKTADTRMTLTVSGKLVSETVSGTETSGWGLYQEIWDVTTTTDTVYWQTPRIEKGWSEQ